MTTTGQCADSRCKGPGGLQGPGSVGHQVCGFLSSALGERLADADSHHVLTMMIGGKLHLAPLDKGIQVCQEPTPSPKCRGSTDCASSFPESRRHRNRNRDMGHARHSPPIPPLHNTVTNPRRHPVTLPTNTPLPRSSAPTLPPRNPAGFPPTSNCMPSHPFGSSQPH